MVPIELLGLETVQEACACPCEVPFPARNGPRTNMAATEKGECPTHERGTDDEVAWVDTEVISVVGIGPPRRRERRLLGEGPAAADAVVDVDGTLGGVAAFRALRCADDDAVAADTHTCTVLRLLALRLLSIR